MHAAQRTSKQRVQGQTTYPLLSMVGRLISFWRPRASRSYSANWGCPIFPFTLACSSKQAASGSMSFSGGAIPTLACSTQITQCLQHADGCAASADHSLCRRGRACSPCTTARFKKADCISRPQPGLERQRLLSMHDCQVQAGSLSTAAPMTGSGMATGQDLCPERQGLLSLYACWS